MKKTIRTSKKMGLSKFLLVWLMAMGSLVASAQQTVSGTVSDADGPLPGASVVVKGTTRGVSTDFDGNFSIEAAPEDVLLVTYIGYTQQEITVGSQTQINVILEAGNKLDEVVVIGYGTQRKSDLTGSVASVSSEEITQIPTSRVDQVLQGRAAGVQVTQSSGAPGAGTAIRVRGGNSITGSNEPLFVIDGIVVGTNFNLNNINPNDIQSLEILKDASSIAIYGSRGANGVVLVTTKSGRGRPGKPQVSVNTFTSMQMLPELPDILTREEQIAFTNEHNTFRGVAIPFPDDPSTYPDNDWVGLTTGAAPIHNVDISIAGSAENVNYYNSFNYFNQEGIVKSTGIEKFIFRSNLDIDLNDNLKAGFRINYSRIKNNNGLTSFAGNFFGTLRTQPAFNDDGTFNGFNDVVGAPFNNPLANFELNTNETFTNNLLATAYLEYRPAPGWTIRSTFSPEFNNTKRNRFNSSQLPGNLAVGITDGGNASVRTVAGVNINNENTIQYQTDIDENHGLTVLAGASFQKITNEITEAEAFGITSDATGFNNLGNSDPIRSVVSSDFNAFQIASFFGRINYDYKNKYLLTLVGRSDGSSVFAPGNKYEFYPSVAGAWKISEEDFMQDQSVFSDLKLRASWGRSGNQAIGPYRTLGLLTEANTTLNGAEVPGLTLGRPANPNLQWETTSSLDIAIEASLFGGRIFTEFNYYQKETNDLLLDVTIPRQTGFTSQLQNVGSLANRGWELLINSTNISNSDFTWNSTLTLARNKNEILDLGGQPFIDLVVDPIIGSGNTRLIVGESVPVFTGLNYLGTWKSQEEIDASGRTDPQVVGGPRFQDLNGDGIASTEDNVVLGSPFPDLIFGLENSFSYKNFDFTFFFQGTTGNEVFNLRMRNHYFNRAETVKFGDLRDRWTPDNPNSNVPRAGSDSVTNTPINSEYVEDGSHIRLKTVRLAYNFPANDIFKGVKNATVYVSGANLLLFSKTRLIEPEANNFNEGNNQFGNIALGFLDGQYPNPRIITLGLNVTF
ncbi:TonB-dependent Receptor [Croceitalea dokdonensis DOKDO 023]|uniref:TonB-dependent Receptor n=1 Tax=Croceitalea dokdonensis DOKDO 023 TaxID=1300341 RepID=A0A0N8H3J9_9FLAO|nr:TonB-dependent receptor [Croceitalea dokdonensis]KPM30780.1 TonB-dependent Receptor [Croceitalea dokdonensis DOKDO 023]